MAQTLKLDAAPKADYLRLAPADHTAFEAITTKGAGKYRAGLIEQVSLMTAGECLGHQLWADHVTLHQVAELANRGNNGVKSRFAHPSMSNDGIGRHLGRVRDVQLMDGKVIGDLHLQKSAHDTPDGNLAEYVMQLADEDPAAAGLSIVFMHDVDAELAFLLENGAELSGGQIDMTNFDSPDPLNTENFPHVRLKELRAADVVDEPAANPDGLFDRTSVARNADAFLAYCCGQTDQHPAALFGVDPDRGKAFVERWLAENEFSLTHKGSEMDNDTSSPAAETPEVQPLTRDDIISELNAYTEAFGPENGAKWFADGLSMTDAQGKQNELLAAELAEARAEIEQLKKQVADVSLGEAEPVDVVEVENKKKPIFNFAGNVSDN